MNLESGQSPPLEVPSIIPPDDCAAVDRSALAERIRTAIESEGWAWVRHKIDEAEFDEVASRLGVIELRTDIMIDPDRERAQRTGRILDVARPGVYQAAALDLHTDRPSAALLAWYCIRPDREGGATLLVDTRDLPDHFSANELEGLGRIQVAYTTRDSGTDRETIHLEPLFTSNGRLAMIFYVPWQVQAPSDPWGQQLLAKFRQYVRDRAVGACISVRLESRESLFIDNRRMLHGRGPLPSESERHLVRLYLRLADDDRVAAAVP
jgi:Taurine catabolism dioxygenase TauD, TfdA family